LHWQDLAIHIHLIHDPADRDGHLPLGSRIVSIALAPMDHCGLSPRCPPRRDSILAWWQIRGALPILHGIEIEISTWE
jgi:hypothetical protein